MGWSGNRLWYRAPCAHPPPRDREAAHLNRTAVRNRGDEESGFEARVGTIDLNQLIRHDVGVRLGWTVAIVMVLLALTDLWPNSAEVPAVLVLVPAGVLLCFYALWATWVAPPPKGLAARVARGGLWTLAVLVIALQAWTVWRHDPAYGTDAVAFNEGAAHLLKSGVNPYGQDLSSALETFQVPPTFHTLRLDGGSVDLLSYPAGSFLPIVLALVFGVGVQAGNVVGLTFWIGACVLLGRLLPSPFRWLAIVLLVEQHYVHYVLGGVTDVVYLPFLMLALWRWDRFKVPGVTGVERWIGPIAFGLACTVKQTPWFLLPFLLIGLWYEARGRSVPGIPVVWTYFWRAGAVFLAVNLPFILMGPADWVAGAVLPLVEPTVPDGVGLVTWMVIGGMGGGNLGWLTIAGALAMLVSIVAFAVRYDRCKRFWPLVFPVLFVVPSRSLTSYLIMMLPAAILAAVSVGPPPAGWAPPRFWLRRSAPRMLVAAACLVLLLVGASLSVRPPVQMTIESVRTTGARQSVSEVMVQVTNHSNAPVSPHFTINTNGRYSLFWEATPESGGPLNPVWAPGETRRVVLHAPNPAAMPGVESTFFVNAFSDAPKFVARSDARTVSRLGSSLSPASVPDAVRLGVPITMSVQLRDRLGVEVHEEGVTIEMGQIVYAQNGLLAGVASINGSPQGRSPVAAVTDSRGIATFTVRGLDELADPVYFQTWIDDGRGAPYGYSNITSVRFVNR